MQQLAAVKSFALLPFLDSVVSLATAFLLGTLIGAERQYRQRTAGLRTNVLVALGAAAFVDGAMRLDGAGGAVRVISYVVSGVGFLGAGAIMKEGLNIRGLNTAATLWGSAAVGAAAGSDLVAESVLIALLVLLANTALRPLSEALNRRPLREAATEATYEIQAIVADERLGEVRAAALEALDAKGYPIRETRTEERSDGTTELVVILGVTVAVGAELDAIEAALSRMSGVRHASWAMRTAE
ncbi:MgtC/SapB family protein [Siccirubricoccus sp. KC 17139]|uniref:Protein MgtC n=1 Tax=Siccirubricoccus soli TaxID=2899147 RepID=A0ABT1CZ26_9PROT|nr:MgtC/SapB family protein [Siccirubricoccus soli]MCO6414918.1 MgtC/SapB family protein [Siccirubricoccus soli]MCP2681048.1 MgtC/SapB family protein [Siccirubricoccus soli]